LAIAVTGALDGNLDRIGEARRSADFNGARTSITHLLQAGAVALLADEWDGLLLALLDRVSARAIVDRGLGEADVVSLLQHGGDLDRLGLLLVVVTALVVSATVAVLGALLVLLVVLLLLSSKLL